MISLGQASNYSLGQVFGHLFACGTKRNSDDLRSALAKRYDVKPDNVALYHTGRSALAAAIRSVRGDNTSNKNADAGDAGKPWNVIIPGLTCIAVVRAVKAAGCNPVFVDIMPENLAYNYEKLSQKLAELTAKSKHNIILMQNTLGITWDAKKLEEIAKQYGAHIIEDLAHCAGRFYADGREVGTVGEAAALSFGKGKAIDTISGGALILRNGQTAPQPARKPKLSDRLRDRWYPLFGWISRGLWQIGGFGRYLMGGLVKIHWVQRSADAELNLDRRLTHWQAKLAAKQLAKLPRTPLRDFRYVDDRAKVLLKLQQNGYNFEETWYDTPVSPRRYAGEVDFPDADCPETMKIAQKIINFPTWYSDAKLAKAYEITKEHETAEQPEPTKGRHIAKPPKGLEKEHAAK